jgi:hypothetical protein
MMPEADPRGDLGKIPIELWSNITKFLAPQDIVNLKKTGASVNAEIEAIKVSVPPDKWKAKIARLDTMRKEIFDRSVKLSKAAQLMARLPSLDDAHFKILNEMMGEEIPAYEEIVKQVRDKAAKLKLRKNLTAEQTKELDAFLEKMTMAEKTHQSQLNQIARVIGEKRKIVVPGTKKVKL